jgi:hypothetical protein
MPTRPAPPPKHVMDRVAVNEGAVPAPAGREALGKHADNSIEIRACKLAEGPRASQALIKRRLFPILSRHLGHDLLLSRLGALG